MGLKVRQTEKFKSNFRLSYSNYTVMQYSLTVLFSNRIYQKYFRIKCCMATRQLVTLLTL